MHSNNFMGNNTATLNADGSVSFTQNDGIDGCEVRLHDGRRLAYYRLGEKGDFTTDYGHRLFTRGGGAFNGFTPREEPFVAGVIDDLVVIEPEPAPEVVRNAEAPATTEDSGLIRIDGAGRRVWSTGRPTVVRRTPAAAVHASA